MAVEMLGGVLQESIPHVMVLDGIQGNGLKPPPPKGDNQWITTFQNLLVPSVFLNSSLSKTKPNVHVWQRLYMYYSNCENMHIDSDIQQKSNY